MIRTVFGVLGVFTIALFACAPAENTAEIEAGTNAVSADIEPFLETYFASWSANDMETYRSSFDESAVVLFVRDGEVRSALRLNDFMDQQAGYLAGVEGPVSERMTFFSAAEDSQASTVMVRWLYEGEGETSTGTDRFTLIRAPDGAWKIAALVWYRDRE
jgi:hypothetical protein